jgi:hypothetical protein
MVNKNFVCHCERSEAISLTVVEIASSALRRQAPLQNASSQ